MSTSLLYHEFGIRGYRYQSTPHLAGELVLRISQPLERCRCSACGSANVAPRGQEERSFRSLPIGRKRTTVVLPIPRV
ncbi:MAG TPA: transposase family protein, partial [Planctomycetaceae bacterium]|nr:transposase family protein [Planctomycetaceae bacterium]